MTVAKCLGIFLACLTLASVSSRADEAASAATPPAQEAQIAFADKNIWNWQVVDNRTVLIETVSHKWYKAILLAPCTDLPFSEKLGFESSPSGSFDKFGSIKTRSQSCNLISLTATPAPPKKDKKKAAPPKSGG